MQEFIWELEQNRIGTQVPEERSIHENQRGRGTVQTGRCTEKKSLVRDFPYEYLEPALELRTKVRREAALRQLRE